MHASNERHTSLSLAERRMHCPPFPVWRRDLVWIFTIWDWFYVCVSLKQHGIRRLVKNQESDTQPAGEGGMENGNDVDYLVSDQNDHTWRRWSPWYGLCNTSISCSSCIPSKELNMWRSVCGGRSWRGYKLNIWWASYITRTAVTTVAKNDQRFIQIPNNVVNCSLISVYCSVLFNHTGYREIQGMMEDVQIL